MRWPLVVAALALTAVPAACSGDGNGDSGNAAQTPPATSPSRLDSTPPTHQLPEIVDFTAPAVGGGKVDVAALADRPLAFWFWAPT